MFGDGATNQGTFGETMNLAALWKLPVVFMVINNQFGMGTALERHSAVTDLSKKAEGFGVPGTRCDGMDVLDVHAVTTEALEKAREERQPQLVEAVTYRYRGHSMADPEEYRTKEEVEEWRGRDPIATFSKRLVDEERAGRGGRREARRGGDRDRRRGGRVRRQLARSPTSTRSTTTSTCSASRCATRLVVGRRALARAAPRRAGARGRRGRARAGRGRRRLREGGRAEERRRRPDEKGGDPEPDGEGEPEATSATRRAAAADARDALPRGAQPGAARGDGGRRERLPHGRGHRRLPGRLQGHPGAARGVRREARARHADLREHDRRHGRGRGDGRAAAGGRADDDQLLAAGDRPDRELGGVDPLHVRRPGEGAAGDPDAAGRRATSSGPPTRTRSRPGTCTCPACSWRCRSPRRTPRAC